MEISVPSVPKEAVLPVLAHFDTAPPLEVLDPSSLASGSARVRVLRRARGARTTSAARAPALVVAETDKIVYTGDAAGAADAQRRYVVGVRSRATGKVRLYAVAPAGVVQLAREVKESAGRQREFTDSSLTYMEKRSLLTDTFGSKRYKIRAKTAAASELPKAVADVDDETRFEAAEAAAEAQEAEGAEAVPDLPPFDPVAATVRDAFCINDGVLRPAEWDSIAQWAQAVVEMSAATPEAFVAEFERDNGRASEYAKSVLSAIWASPVPQERKVDWAAALLAVLYITRILEAKAFVYGQKKLANMAEAMHIPSEFMLSVYERFGEVSRSKQDSFAGRIMTSASHAALINHALVIVLSIEKWSLSEELFKKLAIDWHMPESRLEQHLHRIGCTKRRSAVSDTGAKGVSSWRLEAPITPGVIEARRLGGRGRGKK
eukprot:m51a1_g13627 hypothetical protein (433) ;mRNA; f:609-2077